MRSPNLLFTSAGRRDYLIECFAAVLGQQGQIHVGNSDSLCSAFTVGEAHVVTPPIHSKHYVTFLLDYCKQHKIDTVIPLFDIDVAVLAGAKDLFARTGIEVIAPSPNVAEICNDKWKTYQFLSAAGIQTPRTYLNRESAIEAVNSGDLEFPLIVKPRWGMGSIGLIQAEDADELGLVYEFVRRRIFSSYLQFESSSEPDAAVLIQERAKGVEYGLDVFNDFQGRHVVTVAKRKLAMRAGETDMATTEERNDLTALGFRLGNLLGHPGNLDVDVFVDGTEVSVLELNCRFGGGYPFTHAAGANFPAAIIAWLNGKEPNPHWLRARSGVTSLKSILTKPWSKNQKFAD